MARVLIVDDDIAEISAVKRVLSRAGHQPVLATNASDALAAVAQTRPDLLVVGSTCEGGDALRRFAAEDGAQGLPLLVLGETDAAPEGAARLARPLDPAQLDQEVAAALAAAARAGPPPEAVAAPAPRPARPAPPGGPGAPRDDAAAARRSAAAALLARAEELRRSRPTPAAAAPAPDLALEGDPGAAEAPPPAPLLAGDPAAEEDAGLEAVLRRAEEAERAHAAERKARARQADRATVEAAQRAEAERLAAEGAARARAAEERARTEARARAAAEKKARTEEAARARAEAQRRAAEEEARRAEAERGAAEEEARRAAAAEERAGAEADARRRLEDELDELREQVDAERRTAERKLKGALDRAAAEERAAEEIRRLEEAEAERRRQAEEEELRTAISSARAEMDALRRRGEEEARRRAEAEAEVARLAREAERRAAEAAAQPAPFDFPVYTPPDADPAPDPAEDAARRRAAALRERPAPAGEPPGAGTLAIHAPPPELRGGTLEEVPAPRLLALAALAEVSGRIDVEGDASRTLWLEEGRVVGAASGDPADRVEEVALRLGLVTREQHRQVAGAAAALSPRRTALLLLERGFLKPTELTALVRRRTEEVVFGTFSEPSARFRWSAAEVPPDERTALERSTLALAVEGVRRRWLAPRVEAVLGGPGTLLAPVATGPSAADLGLSAQERRAVALADGLRTLDEIVAASPLDPLSTRQALAALVLVGSLAVRVFQGGRAAAAATAAIDLARVREKLEQARRADYFTVLGVGRLCTPHEVRDAAERLSAEFDPRRYLGVREDGLEARLEEIRTVVADAREILADDGLRAEYLRGLGE